MAEYKKLSGSRVSFSFDISDEDLKKSEHSVLDKFRSQVNLKGFRKGHAPDEEIRQAVGMQRLTFEFINESIDRVYRDFILKNKISPIAAPKIDIPHPDKKPLKVLAEVEVFPEVKLGDYKKLKIEKPKVEVKDSEVDDVIETLLVETLSGKPADHAAQKKNLVEVDFAGKDKEGNVIPRTEGKHQKFRLGMQHFLEDLEKGIEGMKPGEEKKVNVKFPKDYPAPDMAGKSVSFDVKLHGVWDIAAKDITEEVVEKVTGKKKPVDEFRKDIFELITKNKADSEKQKKLDEYQEKLAKTVSVDLPETWIQREVEGRMNQLKRSFGYEHDPEAFWKRINKKEDDLLKELKIRAEKELKIFLGLSEIIKVENIELDKDELAHAERVVDQQLATKGKTAGREEILHKTLLNMKIDKYLNGLMI